MRILAHLVVGLAGFAVVAATVAAAVRTVVLPRAVPSRLSRAVFLITRSVYLLRMRRSASFDRRDAVMASYGPVSLLSLLATWLLLAWLGAAAVFWALSRLTPWDALVLSGSSLLTLGFAVPPNPIDVLMSFATAVVGLVLLAMLITYLPSVYGAFNRREAQVSKLEVRAGSPPTGWDLLIRAWALERFDLLPALWSTWEDWFVDLEETHTSFPALSFFRSPHPEHSWVTAAGAVLDAAALYCSTVDQPRDIDAELSLRAGYLALRHISTYYSLPFEGDPAPTDPISVQRAEYDEVVERLAAAGLPLRADRDQAWRDYAGWRVNYDAVLLQLGALVMAPYAPWSSDRSPSRRPRPPVLRVVKRAGVPPRWRRRAPSAGGN